MEKGKVLGLDWGIKQIGIAISDQNRTVATGRCTYRRKGLDSDLDFIKDLVKREEISQLVIGMPLHLDGEKGQSAENVLEFKKTLEDKLSVPVDTVDERLTSAEAERVMLQADLRREKRNKHRDKLAAQLILQRYLDQKTNVQ